MPPRKSEVSKAGTGDEATAAKEALVRDGINIEVCIASQCPHLAVYLGPFDSKLSFKNNCTMLIPSIGS